MDKIEVICIQSDAFFKLLDEVIERLKPEKELPPDQWISGGEAKCPSRMKIKTTSPGLAINKVINDFYACKGNLQVDSAALQTIQADFDIPATNTMAEQLKKLTDYQMKVAEQVNEIHAVQFGKLYRAATTKEKKLTKKQIEKAELMELRREAHLRMMNRPAHKKRL